MADEYIKGKVTKIVEKTTASGVMYDIEIAGQKVGVGKYLPRVKEGGYYKISVTRNGNYLNLTRGTKPEPISPDESDAPKASAPSTGRGGFVSDDKRQEAISRQAARNTAVEFMKLLAEKDALVLPAASAKPAARYEVMRATLEQLTEEFFAYSTGKPAAAKGKDAAGGDGDDLSPNEEDFS